MPRVKNGVSAHRRHKKILKLAKGYSGGRSKLYKTANQSVLKALSYAHSDRRTRKSDFRKLWISRINAASRINGISYSQFMNGLKKANVNINRKMLAELAVHDAKAFANLVEISKKELV